MLEAARNLKRIAEAIRGNDAIAGEEIDLLAEEVLGRALVPPPKDAADFDNAGDPLDIPPPVFSRLERIINESDLLPASFLVHGANVQRSVARVVLTEAFGDFPPGTGWGTGSLVSPSLFMTNNHVIPNMEFAKTVKLQFNYQFGTELPPQDYFVNPNGTFRTNANLDYTILRLKKAPTVEGGNATSAGETWGWNQLNDSPQYHQEQHFNIIQHPQGRRKEVALQDNKIAKLFANVVRYETDTEPASSGSPVFDNSWKLVALHHAGGDKDPNTGEWLNNQGIRIDRIVEDLRSHFADQQEILDELEI